MTFHFFIDGQPVPEPQGWQDFKEELIRDDEQRIIRYNYPVKLRFHDEGYRLIEAAYKQAYNQTLELIVTEETATQTTTRLRAIIKLSNCTWDISGLNRNSVECEIDDTVYQAYIFANEKTTVGIGGQKSINGTSIAPITPIDLTVFNPVTGGDQVATRKAYDVADAMRYILQAISNGTIGFASSWYNSLPNDERLCVLDGAVLRDPSSTTKAPDLNLEALFNDLWRKHNLYLIVTNPLTNPVVRLERESYLHQGQVATRIDDVAGLLRGLDFEKLYGRVAVGSSKFVQEFGNAFTLPYVPLLAFVREEYGVNSPIATEKELNLVSQFVIDNNAIEECLGGSDKYDGDTFLIQYDRTTDIATKGQYFPSSAPARRYYNEQLLNSNVLPRFNLMGDVVLNTGLLDATFQASSTAGISNAAFTISANQTFTLVNTNAYPCDDDSTPPNFDTGGNYDTTTFEFTAPVPGFYRFRQDFYFRETGKQISFSGVQPNLYYRLRADFFKNGAPLIVPEVQYFAVGINNQLSFFGVILHGDYGTNVPSSTGGILLLNRMLRSEFTTYMAAGDVISARALVQAIFGSGTIGVVSIATQATFSNPTTPVSGGTYVGSDPDSVYIGLYTADEIPLTEAQVSAIFNQPERQVVINTSQGDDRITYAKKVTRGVVDGVADVELLFNRKQANI